MNCGGQGAVGLASLVDGAAGAAAESGKQSWINHRMGGQNRIAHENGVGPTAAAGSYPSLVEGR